MKMKMKVKIRSLPDISKLKTEVVEKIVGDFGITKAGFFIREMMSQKIDYLAIKDKLFGDKNSRKVYNEICEWKHAMK